MSRAPQTRHSFVAPLLRGTCRSVLGGASSTLAACRRGIAHDFNNLLNVITGFSDLLVEDLADLASEDPRLHSALGDIEKVNGAAQRRSGLPVSY